MGWYAVSFFVLVFICSHVDRQILAIVVDPVKHSLTLSDSQIGLLQGSAFTVTLALVGLPMAWLLDFTNRVKILAICMALWSVATASCSLADGFWTVLRARFCVAAAEACVPVAALSLIADFFPRQKVARASAFFMNGAFLGTGLAVLVGPQLPKYLSRHQGSEFPLIGAFEPWRGLFLVAGIPGLILTGVLVLSVREPIRRGAEPGATDSTESPSTFFTRHRKFLAPFWLLGIANVMLSYSLIAWIPTLFTRVHALAPTKAGPLLGPIFVLGGILGCLFGAWCAGRAKAGCALQHTIRTLLLLDIAVAVPVTLLGLTSSTQVTAFLFAVSYFLVATSISSAMVPAALIAPSRLRARLLAVCALFSSSLGGSGPYLVGLVTDRVARSLRTRRVAINRIRLRCLLGHCSRLSELASCTTYRVTTGCWELQLIITENDQ